MTSDDKMEWFLKNIFKPASLGFAFVAGFLLASAFPWIFFIPVALLVLWAIGKTILIVSGFIKERFLTNKEK